MVLLLHKNIDLVKFVHLKNEVLKQHWVFFQWMENRRTHIATLDIIKT